MKPFSKPNAPNAAVRWNFSRTTRHASAAVAATVLSIRKWISAAPHIVHLLNSAWGICPRNWFAKEDLFKDRVAIAVKRYLRNDFKRIGCAVRRARHAERICRAEGCHLAGVLIAAYFWNLDPDPQSAEQLPVARSILADLKAPAALVEKVCAILSRRSPDDGAGAIETQIVADAAVIATWEEETRKSADGGCRLTDARLAELQTAGGKAYAREILEN